jgi:Pyridoxamine 5'-phosphate oxidase
MQWEQVEQRQPRLAATVRRLLLDPGVVLVGTIRRDGTPRISPVEPFVLDGDLLLSMLWQSHKAADLARDPRILVHSVVAGREGVDGEAKVRGTARPEHRADVVQRYARAVGTTLGWWPEPGRFHLFAVEVDEVSFVRYDGSNGDQYVACWPPPREFVRRSTSATSVGEPEPAGDLLVAE